MQLGSGRLTDSRSKKEWLDNTGVPNWDQVVREQKSW